MGRDAQLITRDPGGRQSHETVAAMPPGDFK
jgi:hypothetical protein